MRIFNRYLFNAIASATGLVILVLVSIGVFVEFVQQLEHIGQGDYDLPKAMLFVALKMPRLVGGALPIVVLLGALLGLGALANHGELIVMRASGISVRRIAMSIGLAGLIIAILGGLINEFVAPKMDLYARQMRAVAKSGEADMTGSSAWLREGNTIFNLRPSISGTDYGGVYVFRMGDSSSLVGIGRADSVQADDNDAWSLSNYQESMLSDKGVEIGTQVNQEQAAKLSDLLAITAVRESSLTGAELWTYVKYLKSNGLESDRYEIAFWNRIATIAGIAVMCMLALPFVLGPLRSKGAGTRMLIGVFIGVGYFLLTRTLTDSAAVFDLSPILVAWLPTVLLAVVAAVAMRRAQ